MNAPDITVIIAAWNAEAFLENALQSALAQENVAIEVIVANDASTDGTAALVQHIAEHEPRLRSVANPVNQGPSAARNRAIAAARGTWIAVLDADDRFAPGRLASLMSFAEARMADLAFDLFREIDVEGNTISDTHVPSLTSVEKWDLHRWISDNLIGQTSMVTGYLKPLIRRAALERYALRYREELRNSEDYVLVAELLARGGAVWVMPETGYYYTRRTGSISHRVGSEYLEPLLRFELEFSRELSKADSRTQAIHDQRLTAIQNAYVLAKVIAALKNRAPIRALRALLARPQACGQVIRWIGEVVTKRLMSSTRIG